MLEKKTKIVIIGGGFSGVFAAKNILKKFTKAQLNTLEIELISDRNYFVFQPLLPEVSSGIINPHDAVSPLRVLLPSIKHRLATVKNIDEKQQKIHFLQGRHKKIISIDYHQLIIACGQKSSLDLPGFSEHTFTMKDLGDAFLIRNHILKCLELADVTLDAQIKKQALTFVITGAGFSGVETGGELQDMVEKSLKYYPNISLAEINFVILQRDERILTQLTPSLSAYAHKKLIKRGIDIRLKTGVIRATNTHLETDLGEKIYTHTIITTIGSGPKRMIEQSFDLEMGRIPVDKTMKSIQYANIWALGDVALIPMDVEKTGMKYAPPTAQFAVREARLLAHNLQAELFNQPLKDFNFAPLGLMASLGAYQGVVEIGKLHLSGILAWAMWRSIYILKLPGFITQLRVSLNWLMDYIFPRTLVQVSPVNDKSLKKIHLAKGDIVCCEHDLVTEVWLIISGSVACKNDEGEHILTAQSTIKGEVKNYNSSHTHTITAVEDSVLLRIPLDEFFLLKDSFYAFNDLFRNH